MEPTQAGQLVTFSVIGLFVAALVVTVSMCTWHGANTTPLLQGFQTTGVVGPNQIKKKVQEGFAGPAVGAGVPDCLNTSSDCAELSALFDQRSSTTSEGPDDLRELRLILSKISCMKRDLMGNAKVVQATFYQPFSTSHDIEPVAETTARCFAKTIPQRDLSLSFDKWGARGTFLIKRICTSYSLSDGEEEKALDLFGRAIADLSDIAVGECCNAADAVIGGVPHVRMVEGATPFSLNNLRTYEGYY